MKIVFLAGADRASTRLSIETVCRLSGVEVAAVLLDTERPSFPARLKNLKRNVRREGLSYVLFRSMELLGDRLDRSAQGLAPREERDALLRKAFPERCLSLADIGRKYGFPVIEPGSLNSEKAASVLRDLGADLGVVLGGRLLKRSTFGVPRLGCINLHKGRLPEFRGQPPGFWELHEGAPSASVTVHFIDDGLDTGDVVATQDVAIHEKETLDSLQKKLDLSGAELLARTVADLAAGRATREKQPDSASKSHTNPTRRQIRELNQRRPGAVPPGHTPYGLAKVLLYLLFYHARINRLARLLRRKKGSYPGCVLLYHRVNDLSCDTLTTGLAEFAGHLLVLQKYFTPLSTQQLFDILTNKKSIPQGAAVIHFDDCYRDVYANAAPLLTAAGLPAAAFIASGFVGTKRRFAHDIEKYPVSFENLSEEEVRGLAAAGFAIGAHTVNHVNLGSLEAGPASEEIRQSKADLEKLLGKPVDFFSYPFGKRSDLCEQARIAVKTAGFKALFSTYGGLVKNTCDLFDIPRKGAHSEFSPLALMMELDGLSLGDLKKSLLLRAGRLPKSTRQA
ncbi:MAG: polysaccharide deacetylase family protein [Thermodesulfobacteriota bacterium]